MQGKCPEKSLITAVEGNFNLIYFLPLKSMSGRQKKIKKLKILSAKIWDQFSPQTYMIFKC